MKSFHRLVQVLAFAFCVDAETTAVASDVATMAPGSDQQLNTLATGAQLGPDVACRSAQGCVAVWTSDGTIAAQRYDADGAALGTEFTVTGVGGGPRVCMSPSGEFAVTWEEAEVEARLYDSAAAPKASEFQVNTYTTGSAFGPSVACNDSGAVIAWTRATPVPDPWGFEYGVYGQRIDSSGAPQGTEFPIFSTGGPFQTAPDAAMSAAGDFVVTWNESVFYGQLFTTKVKGRFFGASGTPLGSDFIVGGSEYAGVGVPSVAGNPSGEFIVVWSQFDIDQGVNVVLAREMGSPSPSFQVNAHTTINEGFGGVDIAVDDDGGFVVTWASDSQEYDGSDGAVLARWYDAAADATSQFVVHEYTLGSQYRPAVASLSERRARAAWDNSGGDGGTTEPHTSELLLCHGPGASQLTMRRGADPSKDRLKWNLKKSTGAPASTVGDPTTATSYRLDVSVGGDSLLSALLSPSSLWSVSNSMVRYKDKSASFTPVTALSVKHGNSIDGAGAASAKAGGSGLGLPSLIIYDPVSVVLSNAEQECWAAVYEFPALQSADRYKAKQ